MKHFKRMLAAILGSALVFSCAAGCAGQGGGATKGTEMNDTFYNPLRIESGLGDPWLYHKDGAYYLTYSEGTQISITRSEWMTNLTANSADETRTKVIARQKALGIVEIWAPELFFFNGHWYVYYTATPDDSDATIKDTNRRTYCLRSKTDDAMGEWEETATEVRLPEDIRAIDATFMDYGGKQYIIWVGWPERTHTQDYQQDLYIAQLKDGDPTETVQDLSTERIRISTPEYDWEMQGAKQNEGPVVAYSPSGTPVLLYSGAYSGSDAYCIGYLVLDGADKDPLNPESWTKGARPLMETKDDVISPGHNSVVKSPDGTEDWIVYHAAKYSGAGWDRTLRLQKMTWEGDLPVVEMYSYNEEAPMPSGERVNRTRYEAEDAVLGESCAVIESVYEYADGTTENMASGGKAVRISDADDALTFLVNVRENGQYRLVVRYSNQAVSATSITVSINGTAYTLFAPRTPYDDTFCTNAFYCDLYLRPSGPNEIRISCDQNILIDCIIVDALSR